MTNEPKPPLASRTRRAVCATFMGLALVLLFGQLVGLNVLVFLVGAEILLLGGGLLLPIALTIVPVVWARRTDWRWMAAALVPAGSLIVVVIGYTVPVSGILPAYAFANLGPPVIAGQWVAANLLYIGVLGVYLPPRRAAHSAAAE